MKIPLKRVEEVEAKFVEVHVKVCDSGNYTLLSESGIELGEISENYVPGFFPGDHYGDYLILKIDIETGNIVNWKKPSPQEVSEAFGLIKSDED